MTLTCIKDLQSAMPKVPLYYAVLWVLENLDWDMILIEPIYWTNSTGEMARASETYFPVAVVFPTAVGNVEGEVQLRRRKSRHDQSPLANVLKSDVFPGWRKDTVEDCGEGLQEGGKARRKEGQIMQAQNENAEWLELIDFQIFSNYM